MELFLLKIVVTIFLFYSFSNVTSWLLWLFFLGGIHSTGSHNSEGVTVSELKQCVEEWMSIKFQVTLNYDPTEALKQLENFGLLVAKQRGMQQPGF